MLSPEFLGSVPQELVDIYEELSDWVVRDIARRIAKVGEATSTAEIQRVMMQQLGSATGDINKEIAEVLKVSEQTVEELFRGSTQIATDNQAELFESAGIKPNTKRLEQITNAAIKTANGDFLNMTKTLGVPMNNGQFSLLTDSYRQALSFAQMQVATGAIDYNTAIRSIVKNFTASGLCTVGYKSGRVYSIESAARLCVLNGVSQMAQEVANENGRKFGADGYEITAHSACAPDHEPYQGRQYTIKEYEALNGSLSRSIGTLNCGHMAFPILLGISERAYSEEELDRMAKENAEGITYEGEHYTKYEASQQQRKIERAIRKTKREIIGADKTKDADLFTAKSIKLRRLREYYGDFSSKAGLITQNERAQVGEFTRSMSGKVLNAEKRAAKTVYNGGKDGIIYKQRGKIMSGINNIDSPIEQRNTAKGNPNAILQFDRPLNNRQQKLLDSLPKYDSRLVVKKKSVNMKDLSALTAQTGDEFALFTKGNERLIIRGNAYEVNIDKMAAKSLNENGYRWSGHTHPGTEGISLVASEGDKLVLNQFSQENAVIYNSKGLYSLFNKE